MTDVPRRFYLQRDTDHTGISGTGRVADGILWADDTVTVRWLGDHPSTVNWGSLADLEHVNGHAGATRIIWLDGDETVHDPDLPCMHCIDGHPQPNTRYWGVRVSPLRRLDGKPDHLIVQPSAGQHVANEDATWLWNAIRNALDQPTA